MDFEKLLQNLFTIIDTTADDISVLTSDAITNFDFDVNFDFDISENATKCN